MSNLRDDLQLIRMLAERLERISADSVWAHRASGIRGALLRQMEDERNLSITGAYLNDLIAIGFRILEDAASERIS